MRGCVACCPVTVHAGPSAPLAHTCPLFRHSVGLRSGSRALQAVAVVCPCLHRGFAQGGAAGPERLHPPRSSDFRSSEATWTCAAQHRRLRAAGQTAARFDLTFSIVVGKRRQTWPPCTGARCRPSTQMRGPRSGLCPGKLLPQRHRLEATQALGRPAQHLPTAPMQPHRPCIPGFRTVVTNHT